MLRLVLAGALLSGSVAAAPPERVVLTLSGGVSLGSYEAGAAWTLVRGMKIARARDPGAPELVAIAGASAGSINGLLAAALWCEDPSEDRDASVDDNMLAAVWLPVGLDALVAGGGDYRADDGLFARRALLDSVRAVQGALFGAPGASGLQRRKFTTCRLPAGINLTRAHPEQVPIAGLPTRTSRALLPWVLEGDATGGLHVRQLALRDMRRGAGAALYLPLGDGGNGRPEVDAEDVIRALVASSAFPIGFTPHPVCHCASRCSSPPAQSEAACSELRPPGAPARCEAVDEWLGGPSRRLCAERFYDGGIFDNAPLGLAVALAEAQGDLPATHLFVDPAQRRLQSRAAPAPGATGDAGLEGQAAQLLDAADTARDFFLHSTAEQERWNLTGPRIARLAADGLQRLRALVHQLQALPQSAAPLSALPAALTAQEHERQGRVLSACLDRAVLAGCAQKLLNGADEPAATAPSSDADLRALAAGLARLLPRAGKAELEDALALAAGAFEYLAGEIDRPRARAGPSAAVAAAALDLPEAAGAVAERALAALRATALSLEAQAAGESQAARQVRDGGARVRAAIDDGQGAWPATDALALRQAAAGLAKDCAGCAGVQPLVSALDALASAHAAQRDAMAALESLSRDAAELEAGAPERSLRLFTRYAPLAGSQLKNFGAFLDRPLRQADFLTGVWDGAHQLAARRCLALDRYAAGGPVRLSSEGVETLDLHAPATWQCLALRLREIAADLDFARSERALAALRILAFAELSSALGAAERDRAWSEPAWDWLRGQTPPQVAALPEVAAVRALAGASAPCADAAAVAAGCPLDPMLDPFLAALEREGYRAAESGMQLALRDRMRFWATVVRRGVERAASLELLSRPPPPTEGLLLRGLGAADVLLRRAEQSGFLWDTSTIPTTPVPGGRFWPIVAAHLLPYRVSLDLARGGVAASFLDPSVLISSTVSVRTAFDALDYDRARGRLSTSLAVFPEYDFGAFSLGAGPRASFHYTGDSRADLGFAGTAGALQHRLSLTVGTRELAGVWFVQVSLADLNGLLYWLSPWRN